MRTIFTIVIGAAAVLYWRPLAAQAEVLDIAAHVQSSVREIHDGAELQSDFAMLDFPDLATELPLAARTNVERLDENGNTLGGGLATTVFHDALVNEQLIPTDFGMELVGFSGSSGNNWILSGAARQTRNIRFNPLEVGMFDGQAIVVNSTVLVNGVLLIVAESASQDLSGTSVSMRFSVTKSGGSTEGGIVLEGGVVVNGGVNGTVTSTASGAVNGFLHGVLPLDASISDLPLVRVVAFNALLPFDQYAYEYQAVVGEEFSLELSVECEAVIASDGVGAAAVFGLPQQGLEQLLLRTRDSDAGLQVQQAIDDIVDTTGADAKNPGTTVRRANGFLLDGLCGSLGGSGLLMLGLTGFSMLVGRRQWHGRRQPLS